MTTVKTTRKTTSSPANGTTVGSDFSISKFTDIKGHVNTKIYNAFTTLGFQFKINPSLSSISMFSVRQHNIQLKTGRSSIFIMNWDTFLSLLKGKGDYIDKSNDFISIFNTEKSLYRGNNKTYITQDHKRVFCRIFSRLHRKPIYIKTTASKDIQLH